MKSYLNWLTTVSTVAIVAGSAATDGRADPPVGPFRFKDVSASAGLYPHVDGMRGHSAAWGDVDGDGFPDLFVGTFHNSGSKPAVLLRNRNGRFEADPQDHLRVSGIGSGALFVDLTNSGKLDLYASHCVHGKDGVTAVPSKLFRNDGNGQFTDVSADSSACPPGFAGRGLTALDYDGDGLLDLLLTEQYYSSKVSTGPVLLRNLGGMKFENVSAKVGLPAGFGGLSAVTADFNRDGRPDIFLCGGTGDHRMFINDGRGKFVEAVPLRDVFRWKDATSDNTPAGVTVGDVNGDGRPDIVIGNHFKTPWASSAPIRLYLNTGVKEGMPSFEVMPESCGLKSLPMKAPHVEIHDFDNDGRPDIYVSIVKFVGEAVHPVIFRNLGNKDGRPQFEESAWKVNDYPTAEDRALKRAAGQFEKILKDKKVMYMAAAPACDYDRDGKMDLFLLNWWLEAKSLLLRNETPGGNWLAVRVEGSDGVNKSGLGSVIEVFPAGKGGSAEARIATREIAVGYGYCSGQEAIAHVGLGEHRTVDIVVTLPHGKGSIRRNGVAVNQYLVIKK